MKKDYSYGIVPIYVNEIGEKEFLVIHQKTKHGSYWGLPKGHMEKGENEIQAAKRELYEEVDIKDIEILENKSFETQYFFEENGEKIDKTSKYWIGLVDNKDTKIQQAELLEFVWLNELEVKRRLTHNNNKMMFDEILKFIKNIDL